MNRMPEQPDNRHLEEAQGWLGLGDWTSANEALDRIQSALCTHPAVLEVRVQVYEAAGQWAAAAEVSRALTAISPECAFGWIHWAYSLYVLKQVREARDVLLSVEGRFPNDQLIHYSLACCACRLGNFTEASRWLEKVISLTGGGDIRRMVFDNPDFQPLWGGLEKT